ncbi:cell division topological specificity factor MinE [Pycnococcus provasolii]
MGPCVFSTSCLLMSRSCPGTTPPSPLRRLALHSRSPRFTPPPKMSQLSCTPALCRRRSCSEPHFASRRLRSSSSSTSSTSGGSAPSQRKKPKTFFERLHAAFRTFFPAKPTANSARVAAKNRLRMILVADRCALAPESIVEMRQSIVNALSDYVEIEDEEGTLGVDVSVTTDEELGTVYSVSVPVKRVRAEFRDSDVEEMSSRVEGGGYRDIDIKWE